VFVGLGTPPPESLVPQADKSSAEGAFVELRLSRRCPHAYFAAPFALTSERALELLTPDSDDDCADERYLPPGRWQHVALRREGERVTSKVALENGCGSSEETLTLAGPLGALPELLVGFGGRYFKSCARAAGTATIRNLTLRLLDGPESCREGTHACRGEAEEPVCADLSTYPEHCGSCAHACAPNERCRGGRCVCSDSPGVLECDGACVDVQSSLQHCGGCDQDCAERCTRGVCDVIFGTCDRPYELAPEGGSFILDFSRADPIYETVACDFGLDTAVFAGEARLHHVTLVNYTPARSGNLTIQVKDVNLEAVLAANEGGDETLDTVLGLSDASQRSCFHWVNCNENGPGLIGGSRLLAPVSAGTTYRIAVGINGKPTESMTAEFEVELE
jgi:hypothetical protein